MTDSALSFPLQTMFDRKVSVLELQLIDIEESINYSMKAIPPLRQNYQRCMQIFFSCEEFFQTNSLLPVHKILKKMHSCLTKIFSKLMQVCDSVEIEKKFLQNHFDEKTKEYTIKKVIDQRNSRLGSLGEKPKLRQMGGTTLNDDVERGLENNRPKQVTLDQQIQEFVQKDNKLIDEITSYIAHQHQVTSTIYKDDISVKLSRILEYFKQCEESALNFMNSKEWQGQQIPQFNLQEVLAVCDEGNIRLKKKLARKAAEAINKHVNSAMLKQKVNANLKRRSSIKNQNYNENFAHIYSIIEKSIARKLKRPNDEDTGNRKSNASDDLESLGIFQSHQGRSEEAQVQFMNTEINRVISEELKNHKFSVVPNINEELRMLVRSIMSRLGIFTKQSPQVKKQSPLSSRRSSRIQIPKDNRTSCELPNKYYYQQVSRISSSSNQVAYAVQNSSQDKQNEYQKYRLDKSQQRINHQFIFRKSLQKYPRLSGGQFHKDITHYNQNTEQITPPSTRQSVRLNDFSKLRKHSRFRLNPHSLMIRPEGNSLISPNDKNTIEEQRLKNHNIDVSSSDSDLSSESKQEQVIKHWQSKKNFVEKKRPKISQRSYGNRKNQALGDLTGAREQKRAVRASAAKGHIQTQSLLNEETQRPTYNQFCQDKRSNKNHNTLISIKREKIGLHGQSNNSNNSVDIMHYQSNNPRGSKCSANSGEQNYQYSLKKIVQSIKTLGQLYRKYRNMSPNKDLRNIMRDLGIGLQIFNFTNLISHVQLNIQSHINKCRKQNCCHIRVFEEVLNQNIKAFDKLVPRSVSRQDIRRGSQF